MCTHRAARYPRAYTRHIHTRRRTRGGEAGGNVCRLVGAVLFAASDENGGHPDPLPPRLVYSYLTFPFHSFPFHNPYTASLARKIPTPLAPPSPPLYHRPRRACNDHPGRRRVAKICPDYAEEESATVIAEKGEIESAPLTIYKSPLLWKITRAF